MFRFVDRNEKKHLVLIPGWAFDYRIFATVDLPYNYLFFDDKSILNFDYELKKSLLENGIEKISLLGWSQGAFAACNFACRNQDIIEELILIGMRKKYEKKTLEKIKGYLLRNSKAYLRKFYKECFCEDEKKHYDWFKAAFLKDYLEIMCSERLIGDLEQLWQVQMQPKLLKKIELIKIVHGQKDMIAPVSQAADIANSLPHARFIAFEKTGHLPFLHEDFRRRLCE